MTSTWVTPVEPRWQAKQGLPPGFIWTREPDPSWVWHLKQLRPLTDVTEGLVIVWEPGDEWEPVQRWMIYGVRPRRVIPAEILAQLEGPHPRSAGHGCFPGACLCARPKHRWVGGPAPLITRTQWLVYQEHRAWAFSPLWVLQGEQGGHKRRFTEWESRLSQIAGGPAQPPDPGALPYAEPDSRTWDCLRMYADPALLTKYRGLVDFGMRRPGDLDPTDRQAAQYAAEQVLRAMGVYVAEHVDELAWHLKKVDRAGLPNDDDGPDDVEAAEAVLVADMADDMRQSA